MGTEPTTFSTTDYEPESESDYSGYELDGSGICDKEWVRNFSRSYEPALFLLIFVLGSVGNLLVVLLYSAIRNRLKTMTDVYLLNLAVADLLFLATLPFWAVNAMQGWAHSEALCKGVVVVYKLNFFSSMLLLTCISVDRYVAIVQVTRAHNLRRGKRMVYSSVACMAVWLMSFLLALPEVLFAKVRTSADGTPYCDLLPGGTRSKLLVLSLQICAGFGLPLVVMATCYTLILRTLLQARSFHKHKALRVILAVVVVFVFSQLPYNGHLILEALQFADNSITDCGVSKGVDVAGQVAKSLAYTHACVNPFLYVFVGVRFRRDLLGALKACTRRLGVAGRAREPLSVAKRPSAMSDTETTAALSL